MRVLYEIETTPRRLALAGLLLMVAWALGGCGKKGSLEPPPSSEDKSADDPPAPAIRP